MSTETENISEEKTLYPYQKEAIENLFAKMEAGEDNCNLLYQLPTGGGKTVIFSEIAKHYIQSTNKKVLILTHRIELSTQTSRILNGFKVKNKVISSQIKELPDQAEYMCFVAMVETLDNRIKDDNAFIDNIGLVIIDEAHYNSFRKLFSFFESSLILGVTATPLSSSIKLPMHHNYDELLVGESIQTLIDRGFLSKAIMYSYDVQLNSLKIGINGDYTASSSERLYTNLLMQNKLLHAYEEVSKGKKTLIFNNGIRTSEFVCMMFTEAGYEIKHLDHSHGAKERREILEWFKNKPDAILTSVGILTTGFDEPTVETIILNRATKSLTLYHQMIGRGSRVLPNKNTFQVIDLGNNARRFGEWCADIDWQHIFKSPHHYYENIMDDEFIERQFVYVMPEALKKLFAKTEELTFDIEQSYSQALEKGRRSRAALDESMEQHVQMCIDNSEDSQGAIALSELLKEDIKYRVKTYSFCICKSTESFRTWLEGDYLLKLQSAIRKRATYRVDPE